jgi:hypothetical protein
VYCACRKPSRNTKANGAREKPELSTVLENTHETDWWEPGTTISTTTITITPSTCQ